MCAIPMRVMSDFQYTLTNKSHTRASVPSAHTRETFSPHTAHSHFYIIL